MSPFGNQYWEWNDQLEDFECFTLLVKKDYGGAPGGRWGPGEEVYIAGSHAITRKVSFFFSGLLLNNVMVVSKADMGGIDQVRSVSFS